MLLCPVLLADPVSYILCSYMLKMIQVTLTKKSKKLRKENQINPPNPKHTSSVLRLSIKHFISWLNGSAQNSECTNTVTELWVQYSHEMHLQHAWKYWTLQKRWLVCAGANKDQGARDLKLNWEQKTFYKIFLKRIGPHFLLIKEMQWKYCTVICRACADASKRFKKYSWTAKKCL